MLMCLLDVWNTLIVYDVALVQVRKERLEEALEQKNETFQ